jgi:hypothetical protein
MPPLGDVGPTRSALFRTDVNNVLTRFAMVARAARSSRIVIVVSSPMQKTCTLCRSRRVSFPTTPNQVLPSAWRDAPGCCTPCNHRGPQGGGCPRVATYNTPIQTNSSYPMIGLSGLLNLVAVVEKFRPQAEQEKGNICQPTSSPPAPRSRRAYPGVDAAARRESPTPPAAAQPAAGAPAARRSRAGGGQQ